MDLELVPPHISLAFPEQGTLHEVSALSSCIFPQKQFCLNDYKFCTMDDIDFYFF